LSCLSPRNCFVKIGFISFCIIPFRFVWGITSYIHGDVLTISVLFFIICLAHVWHMGYAFCHNFLKRGIDFNITDVPQWCLAVNNRWINHFVIARWRTIFLYNLENNELSFSTSPKRNEIYRNETKSMPNEINRNEIDRNETKRYNTKWNKTYFNETI
jgi:hypothetical protein